MGRSVLARSRPENLTPIRKLTHLQELKLITSDAGLENLEGLHELRRLYLTFAFELTDDGLKHLSGLKKLELLWLTGDMRVTDASLEYLGKLTDLRDLSLAGTRVSGAGLKWLKPLSGLHELDLSRTKITASGLSNLGYLHGCARFTLPIRLRTILVWESAGSSSLKVSTLAAQKLQVKD